MTTTGLSEIDRDALSRALAIERERDPTKVDGDLKQRPWEDVARSAAYACQLRTLRLKPFQAPPCEVSDVATDPPCYGHSPGEVALRRRMLAAGLSLFEPSPLEALERAERARRERVADGDTGMRATSELEPR
jgi:hypothetical protein